MSGQVQVLLLCLISGLAFAEDTIYSSSFELSDEYLDVPEPYDVGEKIYVAKIDKLFDSMLPVIQRVIIHNGMDPMELPDFSTHILPLPGKLQGKMEFTNGWLQELSKLKRTQHVKLTYADKRMIVEMNLGFDVLDFNYTYLFKYLLVKRVGDVYGRFQRLDCRVLVTIDLEHYRIYLSAIKFKGVGKFELKFEGHVTDPLLNIAAKAVTSIFRRQVLTRVEERGLKLFREMVEEVNKKIPLPDRFSYLSAY